MNLKRWLFSNMFFRNMLADFGGRSAYSREPGGFVPYFKYRIGEYGKDYYLDFPKEPYTLRYHNEIFNKLYEYKGYDIINFLEFHYTAFENKHDFLRFLRYEITGRLKREHREVRRLKLQDAIQWVTEKSQELKNLQERQMKHQIEKGVRDIIIEGQMTVPQSADLESSVQDLTRKLSQYVDQIMSDMEERVESITGVLSFGRIELNNQVHLEKLIQLLVLLQTVQAPTRIARGEQLFKKFSSTDIASILQLHFSAFKNLKVNTLQVKIREASENLKPNHPDIKRLEEALQAFFYEVKKLNSSSQPFFNAA